MNPRRLLRTWVQDKDGKGGGGERMRNDRRCSYATRGVETSGRVWRGSGVYDIHADSVPRQDRMWGEGETER